MSQTGIDEDISNTQRGELNFNEDLHPREETLTQKDIEEENRCLGIDIDKCSTNQSKDSNRYLHFEVPRSLGYVEESTSHGDLRVLVTEPLRKEGEHNAFHKQPNESREANIETVDHQTYKGKPRVGGGKR